ncbi:MAG: pyridine nucleotide-disulfide oxidoreductase [Chlamydiae bacterium]|nr:pyridine nucleotide-disulfide oxidoreductase [Chlamydiota bacterium]
MHKKVLEYFVVGAGPAGIAAVGKLIDLSLDPKKIGWIDTHFAVGDLGRKWLNVSSNNKVDLFIKFLLECKSFHFDPHAKDFSINFIPKENTCLLKEVVYPLQWVTKQLMQKVNTYLGLARCLHLENGVWHINTENEEILSKNVILAIGCDAKRLDHGGLLEIPLDIALNPEILPQHVIKDDTVAVFGSSHSAIPILANLLNLGVKVINFYRSPHLYAVDMGDWTLFDTSGLKGFSADWAKKNLDGKMPSRLERFFSTDKTLHEHLARCIPLVIEETI